MSAQVEKIALFIDGANLYATAKSLGFDIDYKRLLREFQSRGNLLRAFYYTAVIEDQEYSSIRPLIDWLDYNGYTVVTKATKEFVDQTGRRKVKGNMDIELAVDAMELAAAHRPHGAVLRRRRFPLAGRGGAAPRRARHRGLDHLDAAADGRRRAAPPGRHLHSTSSSCSQQDRPRPVRARAARPASRAASASTRRSSCSAARRAAARAGAAPTTISRIDRARSVRTIPAHGRHTGQAGPRLSALPAARRRSARPGASASRPGSTRRSRRSGRSTRAC